MHERVLRRLRQSVRVLSYVITAHAEEEMHDDELTVLDVEHVILSGGIRARQRDREAGGWKYVVTGLTPAGVPVQAIARLSMTGKLNYRHGVPCLGPRTGRVTSAVGRPHAFSS